jgi:hypothetical protein
MSWISPIFDRTLADITGHTSKGYFNVADWVRIHGNTAWIKSFMNTNNYLDIPLISLSTPDTTTWPTAVSRNQLIENIERLRLAACLPVLLPNLKVLPYIWGDGANALAPEYEDVNDWERNLNVIHDGVVGAVNYRIHCGVPSTGQSRMWQHRFR